MLEPQYPIRYLKKEGVNSKFSGPLREEKQHIRQDQKSFQPRLRLRRQYDPNRAELLCIIRGCKHGHDSGTKDEMEQFKRLLEKVGINYQDDENDTFLHIAVIEGNLDIVNLLLEKGIDVNVCNKEGKTAYQLANEKFGSDPQWSKVIAKLEELNKETSSRYTKIDVPKDGSCLFWSVVLAYLIPVKDDNNAFQKRYNALFVGEQSIEMEEVRKSIRFYNPLSDDDLLFSDTKIKDLVTKTFRNRVVDYISNHKEEFKDFIGKDIDNYLTKMRKPNNWGDEPEIRAMSDMLKANVVVSGASSSEYGEDYSIKIKLFHVSAAGGEEDRNHYKFGLEQSIIDSYKLQKELEVGEQSSSNNLQQPEDKLPGSDPARINVDQHSFINIPKSGSDIRSQPIPTRTNRVVKWLGKSGEYTGEQIKENANLLFLFGDNDVVKYRTDKSNPGGGGQASATRPTGKAPYDRLPKDGGLNGNAIGITTTFYGGYTPNINEFKVLMDREFEPIEIWVKEGGVVIIPCDDKSNHNLGTGIADLKNKVPGGIEYIQFKINNLVKSGQQPIQNFQGKGLDTLKQELHDILSKERLSFQSLGGLKTYLSTDQQQRFQQKRTRINSGESRLEETDLKRSKTELQGVKRPIENEPVASKKRPRVPEKYAASGLKSSLHGTVYQLKLLMLFLKRGMDRGYSFRLATEMDVAEKFDDVVFQYTEGNKKVYRFLQAKHKQDEDRKIEIGDLLTKDKNGEFRLAKYFISYLKIKNNQDFADSNLEDFVLCTNIDFDLSPSAAQDAVKKLKVKTSGPNKGREISVELINASDAFFKDGGARYKFSYAKNNMISIMQPILKSAVEEAVEELEKEIKKLQNKSDQDSKKKLARNQKWQNEFKQLIKEKNKLEDNIKEFFNKLAFAVNQPNEIKLAEVIKNELGEEFNSIDRKNVYARFQEEMLDWMKEKEGRFLTHEDGKEFFDKMREEILGNFRFEVRNPVVSFTGRKEELKELHESIQKNPSGATVISQLVSISGLGGVGKTELVRKYIEEHSKDYDNNVIWINAETYETMVQSFLRLAKDLLGIPIKDRNIESIVRDTYVFFAKRRSLFVFDNAEKYRNGGQDAGVNQFLPSYFLPSNGNKPSVLITSRNQEWGKIKVLSLDVWTEEEAVKFVKETLGLKDDLQDEKVKELVKTLQYFPLALQQAVAYIKEEDRTLKNIGRKFKISDYLSRYRAKAKELLEFKFPEESDNLYTKTTFTTWQITLDLIEKKKYGTEALKILSMMGYFEPDDIDAEIFSGVCEDGQEKLGSAIQLLKQYSMINQGAEDSAFNIHRLVQQVIRLKLEGQGEEEEVLGEIIELISEDFEDYRIEQGDLSHVMSIWKYSSRYSKLVKAFKYLPCDIVEELSIYSRYEDAYRFGVEALDLLNKKGLDTESLLRYEIAKVLSKQGKCKEALKMFTDLLEEIKDSKDGNVLGVDNCTVIELLNNIASEYCKLGNYFSASTFSDIAGSKLQSNLNPNELLLLSDIAKSGFEQVDRNLAARHKDKVGLFLFVVWTRVKILIEQGRYQLALNILDNIVLKRVDITQVRIDDNIYDIIYSNIYDGSTDIMEMYYLKAVIMVHLGKYDDAGAILERLLVIKDKNKFLGYPDALSIKHEMAVVFYHQGKYEKALKTFRKVLQERKGILGSDHPDTLSTMHEIAVVLRYQGKYEEALVEFRKVLKKREETLRNDHSYTLSTTHEIAVVLRGQGKFNEALIQFEDVLKRRENILGENHPDTLSTAYEIGIMLSDCGRYAEASVLLYKVVVEREKILGSNHPDSLSTMYEIGIVLDHQGKYEKALDIFQFILERREKALGYDHPDTLSAKAIVLFHQGNSIEALKKLSEALKKLSEVLERRVKILGNSDPGTAINESIITSMLSYARRYMEMLEKVAKGRALDPGKKRNLSMQHTCSYNKETIDEQVLRKITDQKYISAVSQPMFLLEAQCYALNIIVEFEPILREITRQSGILMKGFNFSKLYLDIVNYARNKRYSQIQNILYSVVEEVCPKNKEFMNILKSNIERMLDEQQIVNSRHSSNQTQSMVSVNDKMSLSLLNSIAIESVNSEKEVTFAG